MITQETPKVLASEIEQAIIDNPSVTQWDVVNEKGRVTATWTKTSYEKYDDVPFAFRFGQYDANGDNVFVDKNLWAHRVYASDERRQFYRKFSRNYFRN